MRRETAYLIVLRLRLKLTYSGNVPRRINGVSAVRAAGDSSPPLNRRARSRAVRLVDFHTWSAYTATRPEPGQAPKKVIGIIKADPNGSRSIKNIRRSFLFKLLISTRSVIYAVWRGVLREELDKSRVNYRTSVRSVLWYVDGIGPGDAEPGPDNVRDKVISGISDVRGTRPGRRGGRRVGRWVGIDGWFGAGACPYCIGWVS